ncbi:MAG: Asp-tRNA(Asn)/Glu-tRNA(Gln) amidotransferase subunit GatA [Microgenomates group bacterium]
MDQPKTIHHLLADLKAKKISVTEIVADYLAEIAKQNGELNAFLTIAAEEAKAQAKAADATIAKDPAIFTQKPLFGIPVGHKDLFLTRGLKTTAGSKVLANYIPQYSGTVVKKLENAGAITLGKLNCDAWAHGASGENSDFGPTKNPHNLDYVPGGSSSGSAAAVAADLLPFATGTDTGGSIREPANFCGVVGLKPSYGRVSRYGIVAMASSLDSIGHLTHDVHDAAAVLEITAGKDPFDATTVALPVPRYTKLLDQPLGKNFKVGIAKEYLEGLTDPDVLASLAVAKEALAELGVELVEISLPHTKYGIAAYYIVQPAEVSSNLARYDSIRYGNTRAGFGDEAKRRIMIGTYTLSAGYYDAYYLKAMKVRTLIRRDFDQAFGQVDAILSPTSPTPAFKLGQNTNDPLSMYLADIYTVTANLAGLPGIALPTGKNKNNLPLGIQFLTAQYTEEKLLNLAYHFEKTLHGK